MLYREEQRFRQTWIWALLVALAVAMVSVGRLTRSLLPLIPITAISALFFVLKLVVEVDQEAIRIRFFPLAKRAIPLGEIVSSEARTYRPIREYGGWGVKYGFSGMAYNVSGNRGVQLELRDGKRILIGSQRADELAAVIEEARRGVRA